MTQSKNVAMTPEQELAMLRAENAALKAARTRKSTLSLKVSQKGALSLYGMGRFPVTLYKEQWLKVLDYADTIKSTITDNDHLLKAKGDATDPVATA